MKAAESSSATGTTVQRNIVINLAGSVISPLLGLASAPILASALGVQGRGLTAAGTAASFFAASVLTFGIQEATTHFVAKFPGTLSQTLRKSILWLFALGMIAALAMYLGADMLAGGTTEAVPVIRSVALITPLSFCALALRGASAGLHAWKFAALDGVVSGVVRLAALIILIALNALTPVTAALVLVIAPLLSGLIHLVPIRSELRSQKSQGAESETPSTPLWGYGTRIWLGSLSGVLLQRLDQLLMVPLSSSHQLGLYAVAVSVGELPGFLASSVRSVIFAADSSESGGDDTDRRLQSAARLTSALTWVTSLALMALSVPVIPLLFGAEFSEAIPATCFLLAASAAGSAGSVAGAGLSARGRPELRSLSMLIATVVSVGTLIVLLPVLGATGAAIATLLGSLIAGYGNVYFLHRYFNHPFNAYLGLRRADVSLLTSLFSKILPRRK